MPEPYIINESTGLSGTRSWLRAWLDNYRGLREESMGGTSDAQDPVYRSVLQAHGKRYIGRAPHLTTVVNRHEEFWATRIDVAAACRRLNPIQRTLLAYRYIVGLTPESISHRLDMNPSTVESMINMAVRRVARILDGQDVCTKS